MSLSGAEVKQRVISALRLDKNWQQKESNIFRIRKLASRDAVLHMQSLGPNWLVTLSRSPTTSVIHLSLWRLGHCTFNTGGILSQCVAQFEPLDAFSFAASLQSRGGTALLAVLGASRGKKG